MQEMSGMPGTSTQLNNRPLASLRVRRTTQDCQPDFTLPGEGRESSSGEGCTAICSSETKRPCPGKPSPRLGSTVPKGGWI